MRNSRETIMTKSSCRLEIRAAEGGEDARLFTAELALAYLKLAQRHS